MLILLESPSAVFVTASLIKSMSVSIRNRFHARRAISGKKTTISGYPSLMPACAGFLKEGFEIWTVEIYV